MTEPTYKYVKGEGWIVNSNTYTMTCGTSVRFHFREPETDEYYICVSKGVLNSDADLNSYFLERIRSMRWEGVSTRYDYEKNSPNYHYVTVEKT